MILASNPKSKNPSRRQLMLGVKHTKKHMDKGKLKVKRQRQFSAHHMLLGSARMALDDAESKRPGYFYSELTTITFCGLALEAMANSFGKKFVANWKDFESSSPIAKLRIVFQELKIEYKSDQEPWGTAKWIIKFRNKIAHAKPEFVNKNDTWTVAEYDDRSNHMPKSKLEEMIKLEHARKAYNSTREILNILCDAIPFELSYGLQSDGWSISASTIHEDA